MYQLLVSMAHNWQGWTVILLFGIGMLAVAGLIVAGIGLAVAEWNIRQYRKRDRLALADLEEWKARMDQEDSVLYRDYKSEADLARERVAFQGEVL